MGWKSDRLKTSRAAKRAAVQKGPSEQQEEKEEDVFSLNDVEKYAEETSRVSRNKVSGKTVEDEASEEEEEVLDLNLSDDEYDFGDGEGAEEGEDGEGDEEEGEGEGDDDDEGEADEIDFGDFNEDEYLRKLKSQQLDDEDADILGLRHESDDEAAGGSWGNRLSDYYGATSVEGKHDEHLDRDIDEAKELQRERAAGLAAEDFELDSLPAKKKVSDKKILDKVNAELDAIELGTEEVETLQKNISAKDLENLKKATRAEKLDRIKQESPELLTLLKEFKEKLHEVNNVIAPVLEKVKNNALPTSEGISFLETKHQLLLNYCVNISFYLLLKSQGQSVKDHPVIDQLVRVRAIMEKMKPIEKKLQYQIDKLVRSANLGTAWGGDETLKERANPADLEESSEEEDESRKGLYRPPKLSEEIMESAERKLLEKKQRERQRAKDFRIAEFLEKEFGDAPEESTPGLASDAFELTRAERRTEELEEANMRRMEMNRQEKKKLAKRIENQNNILGGMEDFNDLAVFEDDYGEKKKDEEFMKRKRMRAQMDLVEENQRKKKFGASADEEIVEFEDEARGGGNAPQGRFLDSIEDDESDDEEPERVQPNRVPKFSKGKVPRPEKQIEEGEKRKATGTIEDNRGLRKSRNKAAKNPHTKYRRQFNKKANKLGTTKVRDQAAPYKGERHIATNVARSKTFG